MKTDNNLAGVILAAGKGTRMKSSRPKVMHCLLGKPLLSHVTGTLSEAGISNNRQVVVAGHAGHVLEEYLKGTGINVVFQERQLGTGHAVLCARNVFSDFDGQILIICGDTPLFTQKTLTRFIKVHLETDGDLSILSAEFEDPAGYGRIVRNSSGGIQAIVEEKDADSDTKRIREVNTGTYLVRASVIFSLLENLRCDNAQGEYYLTDSVLLGLAAGLKVQAFNLAGPEEAFGVNSRYQLSVAEDMMLSRIRLRHMNAGVTLSMPKTVYIEPSVTMGPDVVIGPHVVLKGKTVISEGSVVGAFSWLSDFRCEPYSRLEPYSKRGLDIRDEDDCV